MTVNLAFLIGKPPAWILAGLFYQNRGLFEAFWPELLKANPDVNARDNDGILALHHAAYRGRVELVKEMLKRGVDVSAKDKNGKTALDVATAAKRTAIIELLKK